jgi:tetratricopeptide (TPR) repeat protein
MPALSLKPLAVAAIVVAGFAFNGTPRAQGAAPDGNGVVNSNLDSPLFYQLLIGEMELGAGDPATAFEVLIDAARNTKNEQLFRRAVDIALQSRAGDQALTGVYAWRETLPNSIDAHRYLIQMLVALNRSPEAAEPLRSLVKLTPPVERPALISSLPRFFERTGDRNLTPALLEKALQPYVDDPATMVPSLVAIGRASLAAGKSEQALDCAQRAAKADPKADGPVLLALDLLPGAANAEPIITSYLQAQPEANAIRMFYARALSVSQRHADASAQVERVTASDPALPPPWLTLGALQLELRHPKEATTALLTYVERINALPETIGAQAVSGEASDDDNGVVGGDRGLTQAYLMLAQAAEMQGDFKVAEGWLAKVESPQRALDVQIRRASLLARQGRLQDGIDLIRKTPETGEDDARAKILAEVQLLRDAKEWARADSLLGDANKRFPNDSDLLYEQSMMAEKLNRIDEMERLLRRVIELRPDHHHAHNALGFSLADRGMRLPEAKALIQRALELAPGEPFITDSLGWVEYRMGNRDEAIKQLSQAYRSRPDPEIAAHLGEVLWMNGQREEARRILREGRSRDEANDVLRETMARLKVDL